METQGTDRRRWYVLGVLIVSLLVVVLDNTILNVALKVISDPRQGLGAAQSEFEWAINSYTLVFAGLLFTFGIIGDRIGRKRVLLAGMALFGLASLVSSYAQSPEQLIWARAFMGLGGAAIMPQTLAIITNVFEPHERGRAIGIWAGAVGVGIALGPITGGFLLEHFWWGSVFLINVPVALLGIAVMAYVIPESRNPSPGRIDPLGVLLSIVGLVALAYGIIRGGEHAAWLRLDVLGPIVLGVLVLGAFVRHELRTHHPALDVRLFREGRLSAAVGALVLVFFAMSGVIFFMTFYLQGVRGLTPLEAGALTIPIAVGQLIFSPLSSGFVKRYGPKLVCTVGLLLVAAALAGYQIIDRTSPIWVLELIFLVQGIGMGTVMPAATNSIMSAVPRERAGVASALQNTARQVAVALGVAVLGSLVSAVYRGHMESTLAFLPEQVRHVAGESIAATMGVAQRIGPAGEDLVGPAKSAFVDAMHTSAGISAVFAVFAAMVVLKWLPGKQVDEPEPEGSETEREPVAVR